MRPAVSRRGFLRVALASGWLPGRPGPAFTQGPPVCGSDPFAGGHLIGTVPFVGADVRDRPFHQVIGLGLGARRFLDLSTLGPDSLVTPTDRVFVRTSAPAPLDIGAWTLRLGGLVEQPVSLRVADLAALVRPMGTHLIECAGNANSASFGLMSTAQWSGIPLTALLSMVAKRHEATHVLVSGLDPAPMTAAPVPGASWIFTLDDLASSGAFLATAMNGAPLPHVHGAPVRLVVPGWYGCAWIKWVTEITLVDRDTPATAQMKEYAARTHQSGMLPLARDYRPATMDMAAMPIRVERWLVDGRPLLHVVGIVWGGAAAVRRLRIRFNASEPFTPFNVCPPSSAPGTWALWSYPWRPAGPGRYTIVLAADDASLPTRRLDIYFYARTVSIEL